MKIHLFEMNNGKLSITPEALTFETYRKIWERDTSIEKKQALGEFAYVLHMGDFMSPYLTVEENEREDRILKEIGLKDWKPDDVVKEGVELYIRLQETFSMSFLKSTRKAANNLKKFFDDVDLNERDRSNKPVYKPVDITNAIANSVKIIEALDKWEEKVMKEQLAGEDIIRGGGLSGAYEDPAKASWLKKETEE